VPWKSGEISQGWRSKLSEVEGWGTRWDGVTQAVKNMLGPAPAEKRRMRLISNQGAFRHREHDIRSEIEIRLCAETAPVQWNLLRGWNQNSSWQRDPRPRQSKLQKQATAIRRESLNESRAWTMGIKILCTLFSAIYYGLVFVLKILGWFYVTFLDGFVRTEQSRAGIEAQNTNWQLIGIFW